MPAAEGSHSTTSKASTPGKTPTSAKSLAIPKRTSTESIIVSESAEGGSKEGVEVIPLDIQPLQTVAAVVIGGAVDKQARTSGPTLGMPRGLGLWILQSHTFPSCCQREKSCGVAMLSP